MTGKRQPRGFVYFILSLVMLAACSVDEGLAVHPQENYVVPAVEELLDLEPYDGDPCGLLTGRQAERLGLPAAEVQPERSCKWHATERGARDRVFVQPMPLAGIAALYETNQRFADGETVTVSWEPVTIASFPAAFTNTENQLRSGLCTLRVGVADEQSLIIRSEKSLGAASVRLGDSASAPSCVLAGEVAELIIQNLSDAS